MEKRGESSLNIVNWETVLDSLNFNIRCVDCDYG